MISVEQNVGRLIEGRFVAPVTFTETVDAVAKLRKFVSTAVKPVVVCCDAREVRVFPQEVANLLIQAMRSDNPRIEANGLLFGESSVFGLQLDRMFREANNPSRRAFQNAAPLLSWLETFLAPNEIVRARTFLGQNAAATGPSW